MARPPGSFNTASHSPAVLKAARELATPQQAPTRREIAAHLMLNTREINTTVDNLTRTGKLCQVRLRQVEHRTRPVAEYAPMFVDLNAPVHDAEAPASGWADLNAAINRCWR